MELGSSFVAARTNKRHLGALRVSTEQASILCLSGIKMHAFRLLSSPGQAREKGEGRREKGVFKKVSNLPIEPLGPQLRVFLVEFQRI
jgi:hypothetical protein